MEVFVQLLLCICGFAIAFAIIKGMVKSLFHAMSGFMFCFNTLAIGFGTAFILYLLVLNRFHWGFSVVLGLFLTGGIKMLAGYEHPIMSRVIYSAYGIVDGIIVGYLISTLALKVDFPTTKAVFTYLASIIGMLMISYLNYYQSE